jgi:hypothetical protein
MGLSAPTANQPLTPAKLPRRWEVKWRDPNKAREEKVFVEREAGCDPEASHQRHVHSICQRQAERLIPRY